MHLIASLDSMTCYLAMVIEKRPPRSCISVSSRVTATFIITSNIRITTGISVVIITIQLPSIVVITSISPPSNPKVLGYYYKNYTKLQIVEQYELLKTSSFGVPLEATYNRLH